jgi:RHS repeat-associated protein
MIRIKDDRRLSVPSGLEERWFAQHDAMYNITSIANYNGQVAERYVYTPFGEFVVVTAGWDSLVGGSQVAWRNFDQGGRYDATTGLYIYGERDYSPTLGRWMQQDNGGGYVDGANLYLARLGAPINHMDPTGRWADPAGMGSAVASGVAAVMKAVKQGVAAVGTGGTGVTRGSTYSYSADTASTRPFVERRVTLFIVQNNDERPPGLEKLEPPQVGDRLSNAKARAGLSGIVVVGPNSVNEILAGVQKQFQQHAAGGFRDVIERVVVMGHSVQPVAGQPDALRFGNSLIYTEPPGVRHGMPAGSLDLDDPAVQKQIRELDQWLGHPVWQFENCHAPGHPRTLGCVWKQHSGVPAYHCQLKHTMEINRQLLESRADAAVLLEPADGLLDNATAPIGLPIEFFPALPHRDFVFPARNHRLDPLCFEPVADALHAVALVAGQFLGLVSLAQSPAPPSDQACDRLLNHQLGTRGLVYLAAGHFDCERSARAVSNQVELRSKPASAAAQSVVGRFIRVARGAFLSAPAAARAARTLAPSTHHSSQSINPRSSSLTCKASMILAKTPSRRHLAKWSYTVCQGPNRSGRSRQGAPVAKIQNMPLSISLGSLGGRPVRAFLRRTNGSTNCHCSSVSSCRFMVADLHVVTKIYRQSLRFSDRA